MSEIDAMDIVYYVKVMGAKQAREDKKAREKEKGKRAFVDEVWPG